MVTWNNSAKVLWDPAVTETFRGGLNESSQNSELWFMTLRNWHLQLFLIPAAIFTTLTLTINPLLLISITSSRSLRQETRYILLANTLLADVLFLVLNLSISICNMTGQQLRKQLCEVLIAATVTAYCGGVMTITFMVVDTYVAVRWPLHYQNLLPTSRTKKILAGVWILAALYPTTVVIILETLDVSSQRRQRVCLMLMTLGSGSLGDAMIIGVHTYFSLGVVLCSSLILYCYIHLYFVTKTAGIWQSRYSRARVTLLAHAVMLLLYFGPGLVFAVELILFHHPSVSMDVRVWVNITNFNLLMLLPRACFPYLYGLRYREISDTLRGLFHRRKMSQIRAA
nr:PREDICTED: probable G-protein coupled receptor 148 [Lepisosteus oculatus]